MVIAFLLIILFPYFPTSYFLVLNDPFALMD